MSHTPEQRRAMRRMFGLVPLYPPPLGTVAAWDLRTSMDDARIALQITLAVPLDDIDRQGYLISERKAA